VFKKIQPVNKEGDMCTTSEQTPCLEMNYETKDSQGAPWFPAGNRLVWVKRPVYVVELAAKDAYYNYGTQRLWVDADNALIFVFKVICDRAGKYWKCLGLVWSAVESEDKSIQTIFPGYMVAVDDRTDHATQLMGFSREHIYRFYDGTQKERDYSLAGFQRLAK
jgi:hypothetical protein